MLFYFNFLFSLLVPVISVKAWLRSHFIFYPQQVAQCLNVCWTEGYSKQIIINKQSRNRYDAEMTHKSTDLKWDSCQMLNRIVLHHGRVSTPRPGSVNGNEQPLKEGSLGKLLSTNAPEIRRGERGLYLLLVLRSD